MIARSPASIQRQIRGPAPSRRGCPAGWRSGLECPGRAPSGRRAPGPAGARHGIVIIGPRRSDVLDRPGYLAFDGPDAGPDGLFFDVSAELNLQTDLVIWTFTSLDPTTLDIPMNAYEGFLPPDQNEPEGEGFPTRKS